MDSHLPEKAEAAFREAVRRDPQDAGAWVGVARALGDERKYPEELAAAREAAARFPRNPDALFYLAFALGDNDKAREAIDTFNKVLVLNPAYPHVHAQLSWTYLQMAEPAKAVAEGRLAVAAEPAYAFAYKQLGDALSAAGKNEESIPVYEKAAELDPSDPWALKCLSARYSGLDRYPEAVKVLERALTKFPDDRALLLDYGQALQKVGRDADAERALGHAEALARQEAAKDPRDVGARNAIGVALEYQGKLDEARRVYEQVLTMEGALATDRAIACSNIANVLWKERKFEEALDYRRRAYELTKQPEDLRMWGVAEFCAGHDQQALSVLERASRELGAETQAGRYAAIYAYLVALKLHDTEAMNGALATARGFPENEWPGPCVAYFQGVLPAARVLERATDNDKRTEAHAFIGFRRLFSGDAGGREDLQWVEKHGVPYFLETAMARAYLSR
jgi:tetratricopeptide (TPR) repeat protein